MKKVKIINGAPESNPGTKFGSLATKDENETPIIIFWESKEEQDNWKASVIVDPPSKDKELVDQIIDKIKEDYILTPKEK